MALSPCNTYTDHTGRELVTHGTVPFPIACYYDDLTRSEVPWHWHEELEAAIITEGSALVCAGQHKQVVRTGEGFVINSGVLHGAWNVDTDSCRFHSLVFHPRLVGGSLDSVFYQNYVTPLMENPQAEWLPLHPEVSWQNDVLRAIEQAWQSVFREEPGYEFQVRTALSSLIFTLWSHFPGTLQQPSAKSIRDGERIKAMLSYIHAHYADELSIRHIAGSASLSESECLRCFRTTIGTTPIQYLKQYRIQQAAQQLSETGDKVAEIAARCGFQDMSYFTRTFREMKGMTPTEFRREETG